MEFGEVKEAMTEWETGGRGETEWETTEMLKEAAKNTVRERVVLAPQLEEEEEER